MRNNATNLNRAARRLQQSTEPTDTLAFDRLRHADEVSGLDDPAAVAAFLAATAPRRPDRAAPSARSTATTRAR